MLYKVFYIVLLLQILYLFLLLLLLLLSPLTFSVIIIRIPRSGIQDLTFLAIRTRYFYFNNYYLIYISLYYYYTKLLPINEFDNTYYPGFRISAMVMSLISGVRRMAFLSNLKYASYDHSP